MVVVILGVAAGAGVWWYRGQATRTAPTPTAPAASVVPVEAPTSDPPPSPEPAPSTTPPAATTPAPTGFPASARECTTGGTVGGIARSAAGNEVTSCPFAENVRRAYAAQPRRDGVVSITASSPVTGSRYTMSCSGAGLVTCRGGNDALVYLL